MVVFYLYFVVSATATLAKKGIAQPTQQRKYLDVELDTKILTTRLVGGNILKEGEDPVLGEDNDYPDWLWTLKTDRTPLKLEDLEYNTDEYWRYMVVKDKLRRRMMQKKNHKYRIFKSRFTNEPYVMEY